MDPEAEDLATALEQPAVDAHGVDDVLLGEERETRRDAAEDLDLDDVLVQVGAARRVVARLAVSAGEVLRDVVRGRRTGARGTSCPRA